MKSNYLHKNNNDNCILFFNGWGMDECAVTHLNSNNYDIFMFNEYNALTSSSFSFTSYNNLFVVAWSLGVWVAGNYLSNNNLVVKKAIAINGTMLPIDDTMGIANNIFTKTQQTWNERNRKKFDIRMFGGIKEYEALNARHSSRNIIDQKSELEYLENEITNNQIPSFNWNTAAIGDGDLIFTTANQQNYWQGKAKIVLMDMPHYPFKKFTQWSEIIEL
ncbi:MAG: DUF452 family protein [Bacteroidales bacterium]|nr:DUF452 family protein [Bacteroidales bacterium]